MARLLTAGQRVAVLDGQGRLACCGVFNSYSGPGWANVTTDQGDTGDRPAYRVEPIDEQPETDAATAFDTAALVSRRLTGYAEAARLSAAERSGRMPYGWQLEK